MSCQKRESKTIFKCLCFLFLIANYSVYVYAQDPTTKVPILIYHEIVANSKEPGETVIFKDKFEEQMKCLFDNKYTTLSIDELVEFMKGRSVPARSIVLTFDDGWKSVKEVLPILLRYNFKASFWIIPGEGIGGDYLHWEDIIALDQSPNFQVESHTLTHPWDRTNNLVTWVDGKTPGKDIINAEYELRESKRVLEEKLNRPVFYLAWPCGWYNDTLKKIAKKVGYKAAMTVNDGANVQGEDVFEIKRVFVDGACNMRDFEQILKDAQYHVCQKHSRPSIGHLPYD